jgi:hypothetical protein
MNAFLGECPRKTAGATFFQIVLGIVPVCGFGTFRAGCAFNSLSWWQPEGPSGSYKGLLFNDVWPNVFLTLTETLTITDYFRNIGAGGTIYSLVTSGARVTKYAQTIDDFITQTKQTNDGPRGDLWGQNTDFGFRAANPPSTLTLSTFTADWATSNGDLPPSTYHYTAALSNRLDAAASWATWTAQANALLDNFVFPDWNDATGTCLGWELFPTRDRPFFQTQLGGEWQYNMTMAAANGMAARVGELSGAPVDDEESGELSGVGTSYFVNVPSPNAWMQDTPDPATLGYIPVQPNCGAVVCIKSRWQLLGQPTAWPVMPSAPYNHLAGTWAQPLDLGPVNAPAPAFAGSYTPYIKLATNQIVSYLPTDVTAALGAGEYGILGFRPPP